MVAIDGENIEIYYYGNDALGTPEILTDSDNTVVWEAIYKPFGEAEINSHSSVVNNFRFSGQYYDSETGLHYNYHRYYDPSTGRYLTPDPIGLSGGINLFAFCKNNSVNNADRYGLTWSTPNFIDHYEFGEGSPVNLKDIGLLDRFKWASSVRKGVRTINSEIQKYASINAAIKCDATNENIIIFSFNNTFKTETNVTLEYLLFVIGKSTFFGNANCRVLADCCQRTYKINCSNTFYINDSFEDPLDLGFDLPGATPYPINASWEESFVATGSF